MFLKPITKPLESAAPFAVFDIEAKPAYRGEPFNTKFLGGGVYDGTGKPKIYSDERRLWAEVLHERYEGWTLYAHNGSGYDFLWLLAYLAKHRIEFTAYKTGSRIFIDVLNRKIFDSAAVLLGSLDSVSKKLGTQHRKREVPEDFYERIERYDWQGYLGDDLFTLYECIQLMRDGFAELGGCLKATLASTAMDLFRRKYLDTEIPCLPFDEGSEDSIRAAYVGGRVEVFQPKMGEGACWDINSSYPHAMLDLVPTARTGCFVGNSIPEHGICQARVMIPRDEWCPPLHLKADSKLYFPTGGLLGWYTAEELRYCKAKYGESSVNVRQFYAYEAEPIFKSYVLDLYQQRQSGKPAVRLAAKIALNSLYGKTGMRRERQKIVCGEQWVNWPWNDPKALRMFKKFGDRFSTVKRSPFKIVYSDETSLYGVPDFVRYSASILPAIAATITARGRLHLQRLLDEAGQHAVYCDTDSVYRETPHPEECFTKEIGAGLGQLKLEAEIAKGEFPLPKCYWYRTKDGELKGAAKGLPRRKIEDVVKFVRGEAIRVPRVLGVLETLARDGRINPRSEIQLKQRRTNTLKRHPDGRPFDVLEIGRLHLHSRY